MMTQQLQRIVRNVRPSIESGHDSALQEVSPPSIDGTFLVFKRKEVLKSALNTSAYMIPLCTYVCSLLGGRK